MKVFIWDNVAELTERYHSMGGLVVIAPDLETAKKNAEGEGVKFAEDEEPVQVLTVSDVVEQEVYLFPDAGCC